MRPALRSLGFVVGVLSLAGARASDPVGIYAVIDRVAFDPDAKSPERVQVWGGFAMARGGGGDRYAEPQWGYMYFSVTPGKEAACRNEWKDLERAASSGGIVAFGTRYRALGTVRGGDEPPKSPDPYPLATGIFQIRTDTDYGPVKTLAGIPSTPSPAPWEIVKPGKTTLKASARGAAEGAKLLFEIEGPGGAKESSPPVAVKGKEAEWKPSLELKSGASYTWRVWAQTDKGKGEARTVKLTLPSPEKAASKPSDKASK